jgi:YidC/Oxa1 family membrane protein insertase
MPKSAMDGPYAQQQKLLLYVLPVVFAVGGVAFPIGVLIYWTVSNLWTMAQQFYVIRNNPGPGTPAADAKAKRDAHKAARHGGTVATTTSTATGTEAPAPEAPARQQPKKQSREQRKKNRPQGEQK